MLASDWRDGGKLDAYLRAHQVKAGVGWFDNPGLAFAGTPGLTVGQIRAEAELALKISELLAGQSSQAPALERIEKVREQLGPSFAGTLRTATSPGPYEPSSGLALAIQLLLSFARTYLWPLGLALLAWAVYAGFRSASLQYGFGRQVEAFLVGALGGLWTGFWWLLLGLLIVAGLGYAIFRRAEARDAVDERAPDRATNAAMFERENHYAQNHMISVTQRKPGLLRAFASRLIFWAIGELATRVYPPGFLGDIGTIHFARWVTAPRSPDLIFLSNYDSSWESYLEDFITRAHAGLTGVWSNSIGFPRTENLIGRGATDGERFKRYARRSMVADAVLVQRLPHPDHHRDPRELRYPSRSVRRNDRGRGQALARLVRIGAAPAIETREQRDSEPNFRRIDLHAAGHVPPLRSARRSRLCAAMVE